tara:strand:- start:34773 stop:35192 length:420 start_codon:yes stop_codon:yes gene_type:complete
MELEVKILTEVIEKQLGITYKQMMSPTRLKELVYSRAIFSVIARRYLNMTFHKIGELLKRDHSSIIFYMKKHDNEYELYKDYRDMYKKIYASVEALFIINTEFNADYLRAKIKDMQSEIDMTNAMIMKYEERIKNMEEA